MAGTSARKRWLGAGIVLLAGLAVQPWSVAARPPAPVEVLRFNIDDVPGVTVSSDGRGSSDVWQYEDYRVAGSQGDRCVQAHHGAGALALINLNRTMDDGSRCDSAPQPAGSVTPGLSRQWVIAISHAGACAILAQYDARYISTNDDGSCTLNGSDIPRIRLANFFANKLPATTTVDFLVKSVSVSGAGYEVRSVGQAQITGTATNRTVSYDGYARLWDVSPKVKPVSTEFPLRVNMTLERTTLP